MIYFFKIVTFLAGPGVTGVSWEPTDGASIESSLSTSIMETCPTWGIITAEGSFWGLMGWKKKMDTNYTYQGYCKRGDDSDENVCIKR